MTRFDFLRVMIERDMKDVLNNRSVLVSVGFFFIWFTMTGAFAVTSAVRGARDPVGVYNDLIFFQSLLIGLFASFIISGQTFFREKQTGVIETLLCAPMSLRGFWFGKVMGIVAPSYLLALASVVAETIIIAVFVGGAVMPSALVMVHILVGVPLGITAVVGILGFCYLMLGLRENRVVGFTVYIAIFGAISGSQVLLGHGMTVGAWMVALTAAVSAGLILLGAWLSRFLDRERIVTTIS